jgi:hypothetical protein
MNLPHETKLDEPELSKVVLELSFVCFEISLPLTIQYHGGEESLFPTSGVFVISLHKSLWL